MTGMPERWTSDALRHDAAISAAQFRAERLAITDAWTTHYQQAHSKFDRLFTALRDLVPGAFNPDSLADAYGQGLGEALRYLAGPPISDDDLRVIADVETMVPGRLKNDREALRKVFDVVERVIDPYRFPWTVAGVSPDPHQREAALLASSVLLAAQRVATERRTEAKAAQEMAVQSYLTGLGFTEVPATAINTIVNGPQALQFCAECQLGARKADVVVRLRDTRLLAIECKVSNSATNSVKRLNNDAAVKAEYWIKQFGSAQVVPAAVLSGVFNVLNLEQAQERGLALFWRHDLSMLGAFISSTGKLPTREGRRARSPRTRPN